MDLVKLKETIDSFFMEKGFEKGSDYADIEDKVINSAYLKKDFRVNASFDSEDKEYSLTLDRPFYSLDKEKTVSTLDEVIKLSEEFLKELEPIIEEDSKLLNLTTNDCELFLKTGSYDGMASGVIEYKGSLYYIKSITNTFEKDRCQKDREDNVWRHFYVFDLTKGELEDIVMSSLDWMRHINLASLCKDWKSINQIDVSDSEEEKRKHFDGKYRKYHDLLRPPVMKLTMHYSK